MGPVRGLEENRDEARVNIGESRGLPIGHSRAFACAAPRPNTPPVSWSVPYRRFATGACKTARHWNTMSKKMLIDATHAEETRVVVVDGNKVEEFDFETLNKRQLAGNIYLAKVTRVEPSLQAAFIDYGGNRHGFLAFAEIQRNVVYTLI